MQYEARVFGEIPAKANHYQIVPSKGKGHRIIKDNAVRNYEGWFVRQVKKKPGVPDEPISMPFTIDVVVCYSSMRHDLDNSLKTLLDCIQMAGIIKNDMQCREIHAKKVVNKSNPYVHFVISYDGESLIKFE